MSFSISLPCNARPADKIDKTKNRFVDVQFIISDSHELRVQKNWEKIVEQRTDKAVYQRHKCRAIFGSITHYNWDEHGAF